MPHLLRLKTTLNIKEAQILGIEKSIPVVAISAGWSYRFPIIHLILLANILSYTTFSLSSTGSLCTTT